jgi:hypothetical protein
MISFLKLKNSQPAKLVNLFGIAFTNLCNMPDKVIRPSGFSRDRKRLDWLAARYAESHDLKLKREIEQLSRLLGRLKG